VQFLASRGYAVFQPNYRGSMGTAWRFPEEDMWAFRKMHNDVTDGVKTVLKTGLIDANRLAIMGGSFGGYLALSGAVHEPGLYRCAITIAGVFDWERVMKQAKGNVYLRGQYGVLKRELGDPKTHQEKFEELSPIYRVNQIKIPIFVAHGKEDPVASVAQSKDLLKQLKKFGVAYEKQIERGEGHGFHQLEHNVELYTALEAFLGKHLAMREPLALPAK
jgi:dipeptidyl aminopeptidase/acylaminoacyl peptidase